MTAIRSAPFPPMILLPRYVTVCLLLLLAWPGRAQVILSHLESPDDTTTTASATVGDFMGHPPSVVFANALGAASGSFSGPGGASGSFIIRYKGYKVIDEDTFTLGDLHELDLAGSSYPDSWGVAGPPGGGSVGRANGDNEAILIRFDLSGLTLGPGQSVVLKSVKATGNYPQHAAIVRENGPGNTTLFHADTLGLITLDEPVHDTETFAFIHDSNQGGSRLDTITIDIVGGQPVTLASLESPGFTSTTVSATVGDVMAQSPSVVFADALGAASGSFSGPGGASGSFIVRYKGYKVIDEDTFDLGSLHELHLAGSSYPNSWGVEDEPSGGAVGSNGGANEGIVILFDLSGLTLAPGQSVVLKSVKATGTCPQHAAIVRENSPGNTTLFHADASGLIALDEPVHHMETFAFIHDSTTGGSRLDTITLDIVGGLPLVRVRADPPLVFGPGTDVTVAWTYADAPTGATVEFSADKPATFGSHSGTAAAGSVVATVTDGANGDVRFSVSVRNGETEIAEGEAVVQGHPAPSPGPNILLITADDLSTDSVGVFGCPVPYTTPTIDNLAASGLRFENTHVVVASCNPSRNVIMSGLYPHTSGVEGFRNYPNATHMLLPEMLKRNGYFVGIYNKVNHTTPAAYDWDMSLDKNDLYNKTAQSYYTATKQGISGALAAGKPFFLNINISDPHLPYYGIEDKSTVLWDDPDVPSRLYKPGEVVVPGFLPDSGDVPLEVAHYYMSVRRGDDCFAKILEALDEFHLRDHTLILFLSDHGMPQPFAKACIYHQSTRTPLIVSWPGVIPPGTVDDTHMVSAVDIMPTLLDAVGLSHPYGMEGRSFFGALLGQPLTGFDHVIKEADETNNEQRMPMRSVETRRYGYIFNPWSNGIRDIANATENTLADQRMEELAAAGFAKWVARDNHFEYRTKEEFYDYENDPDALNNLIDSPDSAIQAEIARHRALLMAWMERTHDHALVAFRNLEDDDAIDAYWQSQSVDPPVVSESTRVQWMMNDLWIDIVPPRFLLAVDPRLTSTLWECLLSTDLFTWDSLLLTDPNVSYDPVTGQVEVLGSPDEPTLFFRLRGTVNE